MQAESDMLTRPQSPAHNQLAVQRGAQVAVLISSPRVDVHRDWIGWGATGMESSDENQGSGAASAHSWDSSRWLSGVPARAVSKAVSHLDAPRPEAEGCLSPGQPERGMGDRWV